MIYDRNGLSVPFSLLILLSAFYMFYNLWGGSLAAWDEGWYGEVAREIAVEGKGWLTLHYDYKPWFQKPPLFIWMIAIAYKIFGVNEFAVRIWSTLFGFGCIMLLYFMAKKLFLSEMIAQLSCLTLIGFSQFVGQSRKGMMDAPLTFFVLLGIFLFWIGTNKERYLFYIGIVTGIAFMIKSFSAFQIPIILIAFTSIVGEWKKLLNPKCIYGFLIGFFICLPWHFYEYIKHGNIFINEYFLHHIVQRTLEPMEGHQGNILYYFKTIIFKNIPLGAIGLLTIPYILYSLPSKREEERKAFILIISSITVIVMLFSFVSTKLQWYILPVYPFLSLSIAVSLGLILSKMRYRKRDLLVFVILITIIFARFIFSKKQRDPDYHHELKEISLFIKDHSNKDETLITKGIPEEPIILFYSERKVYDTEKDTLLKKLYQPGSMLLLMSKKDSFSEVLKNKKYGLTILKETDKYILYQKKPALLG